VDRSAQDCRPPRVHTDIDRRARLVPLLERHLSEFDGPFSWPRHCVLFCGTWVEKATGHNPLAGRPICQSATDAARVLRDMPLVELVSAALPSIEPRRARIGDIIARDVAGTVAIGICLGRRGAFLGKAHTEFLSVAGATHAWSVG
jgi:hypothetical protein